MRRPASWHPAAYDAKIRRRRFACFTLSTLIAARLSFTTAHADDGYQLGHGYDVGPFNLAGYSDVVLDVPDIGTKKLELDDLSLFASGHLSALFNPFVEVELTHFSIVPYERSGSDSGDGSFVLERLYNDTELTDAFTLRLGKMLAPVGEWNEIHAAPLVLTTVRPAVTYRNFSEYVTGAALRYSDPNGNLPSIQAYWQPDREIFERPSGITYDEYRMVEGFHVSEPLALLDQIGFSFQKSRDTKGVDQSLVGLDFQVSLKLLTLSGEWTYSDLSGEVQTKQRPTEWGGYLAASYALSDRWSAYYWYEQFSNRNALSSARDVLVGVAFHPHPATVIKLEYLQNIGGTAGQSHWPVRVLVGSFLSRAVGRFQRRSPHC